MQNFSRYNPCIFASEINTSNNSTKLFVVIRIMNMLNINFKQRMKKRNDLVCMLAIAIFALTGCSNEDDLTLVNNNEIKVNASVSSTQLTKSLGPINGTFAFDFPIGVFAHKGSWIAGDNANYINNDEALVLGSIPHEIKFGKGPYYYPLNGGYVTLFAFAPRGTVSTPAGENTAPIVDIPINGKDDLMWASAKGRKVGSNPAELPNLQFSHRLTQLQFRFKAATEEFQANGSKVISLKVKQQPSTIHMNVGNGTYTSSGSIDMEALSSVDQTNGIELNTVGLDAKSAIMTTPASGATAYQIVVVVKNNENSIPSTYEANLSVNAEIGKAHMINLTFLATGITANVTVSDWVTGNIGGGQVQ